MNNKTSRIIVFLLVVAAFLAGLKVADSGLLAKIKKEDRTKVAQSLTPSPKPTPLPFVPNKKTEKPEVKFFVMSFCPYGNQAEAGLEPVYQLLKDKVTWLPRYIVSDKKTSCEQSCPFRVFNDDAKKRCETAISQGKIKDMEECQKYFPYSNADECLEKECASLKAGEYDSLHGSQEFNQDIREILAYNTLVTTGENVLAAQTEGILTKWWKFVSLTNEKCNAQDVDTCWKEQAVEAGLNAGRIAQQEKTEKSRLAGIEIAEAKKYNVTGSPTVYINDTIYNGGRSPEDYKKAICLAFENPPEECGRILGQESAPSSGGCGN